MLESRDSLEAKVNETVTILKEQMLIEDRLLPLIQSMVPDQYLAPKITDMFMIYLGKPELLHLLESHQFLKAKVDQAVAVLKQNEMLGELFPLVQSMVPEGLAEKISGMSIAHFNSENRESLKARIAVSIHRRYQVCMVLNLGDVKYL